MKVVILCGGKGTRLREETEYRPKPMVPIGNKPILWHIMKTYAHFGHKEFILCLGYKGDFIKNFFINYRHNISDLQIDYGKNSIHVFENSSDLDWKITLADTGENTMTAGRIERIQKYIGKDEKFLLTYGDGVGDISINEVVKKHDKHDALLTLTAVHPPGRFGEIRMEGDNCVKIFNEKPQTENGWINGGFFVVKRDVFDFIKDCDDVMFEREPIQKIAKSGRLYAYKHDGFWQPMDTFQEFQLLNELWKNNKAPWQVW